MRLRVTFKHLILTRLCAEHLGAYSRPHQPTIKDMSLFVTANDYLWTCTCLCIFIELYCIICYSVLIISTLLVQYETLPFGNLLYL